MFKKKTRLISSKESIGLIGGKQWLNVEALFPVTNFQVATEPWKANTRFPFYMFKMGTSQRIGLYSSTL